MTRVLWFQPRPWGPPRGGGDVRTNGLIQCALEAGHEVGLVAATSSKAYAVPAGLTLIEFAGHQGVTRFPAKLVSRHPLRSFRLRRSDIRSLSAAIARFAPDLVIVSEVMAWSIARNVLPAGVPVVYDAHNVETRLFPELARRATGLFNRASMKVDAHRVTRDEQELLARSDAVMAVSDDDRRSFQGLRDSIHVVVVPSSVPTPPERENGVRAPVVLFLGTLDYPPNTDALDELLGTIMPAVRADVDAQLVVVGRRPSMAIRQRLEALPWAELHEDVPDVSPFYERARCVVLPIRTGGGTKLKVYEALAHGVPVIATASATAGIQLEPGLEVLLAGDAEELAKSAIRVLTDDRAAASLGESARAAFAARLSWSAGVRVPLDGLIRALTMPC